MIGAVGLERLIEEDTHLGWGARAPGGVLQNGAYLFERDAREPIDELRDEGAILEIREQRGYRYPASAEHPSSAHTFWVALNCWAGGPIDHGRIVPPLVS